MYNIYIYIIYICNINKVCLHQVKTTVTLLFRKHLFLFFYSSKLSNNNVSFFMALHIVK